MRNILLIQFRRDISVSYERDCFLRFFKKRNLKLKIIDAFDKKIDFSDLEKLLNRIEGVILGGSGEFYLSQLKSNEILFATIKKLSPFLKYLLKKDIPTLGICFGHQILGYFLGEKVVRDKNQAQTGTFSVFLTKEGISSTLFKGFPLKFLAQFGHKECLKNLPKGTKLLAKTKRCKIAAFQYKNNIYGVQFHPELNYRDIKVRLKLYPNYGEIKENLKPSPLASKVIKNFLRFYTH